MRTIKIGKSPTNDFVVANDTVSRQHAVITITDDGKVMIRDLNSTNGTFIDGERITGDTLLRPGNVVKVGTVVIDWAEIIRTAGNKTIVQPRENVSPAMAPDVQSSKTIGRSSECSIQINHSDVSGRHAILGKKTSGAVFIQDCGSTNGTYVNGNRITGSVILKKGDIVMIAKKYPLSWETYYPASATTSSTGSTQKWPIIAGVAAAIVLAVVMVIKDPFHWFGPGELPPAKIFDMYKNSVVMIYEEATYAVTVNGKAISAYNSRLSSLDHVYIDSDGDVTSGAFAASGTGFFISTDGRIMTNKHVVYPVGEEVKNADRIKTELSQLLMQLAVASNDKMLYALSQNLDVDFKILFLGIARNDSHVHSKNDFIGCTPVKDSKIEELDVAIIQTNTKQTPDLERTRIVDLNDITRPEDHELGDAIHTIGFPMGFALGQTEMGLEANNQSGAITQENSEYQYGHNIQTTHGASGSPVFDCKGRFAGIIVSIVEINGVSTGYNQAIQPNKAVELAR